MLLLKALNQINLPLIRAVNSDVNVDVNIQVDTIPIAFAVLYYLLATKQLSHEEFEFALRKLLETTNKYKKLNRDGSSRVNLLHPNVWGR